MKPTAKNKKITYLKKNDNDKKKKTKQERPGALMETPKKIKKPPVKTKVEPWFVPPSTRKSLYQGEWNFMVKK